MDSKKIAEIQASLEREQIDGWLLYDNHGSNRFVYSLLGLPFRAPLTRRFIYGIPQRGHPFCLVHRIEADQVAEVEGDRYLYASHQEWDQALTHLLRSLPRVAMEYTPRSLLPALSLVDGALLERIREEGVTVVSSANLLQRSLSVLTPAQIISHREAAKTLEKILAEIWERIGHALYTVTPPTEYSLQQEILRRFEQEACETSWLPICAAGMHTSLPHYHPLAGRDRILQQGDLILIDLGCKQKQEGSIYADFTRMAVAARKPTAQQQEIFAIVREAQQTAVDYITCRCREGLAIQGSEVDRICRRYIENAGYGVYFTHRTGHSIDQDVHGAGVNFDSVETEDWREITPPMCFSLEPAIYIPDLWGIRLETNLLVKEDGCVEITAPLQDKIIPLMG